ncbi:MAG TPA: flagellar hook-length control protein FliK [Chromatiales bacterium]|nr:flagellar hook-length control protein FliK [Thiotrichales bacterium]HIP68515.1 flagellar hook-length control protein FliK [Chromatiales bacterium]
MKTITATSSATQLANKTEANAALRLQVGQMLNGKVMQGEGAEKFLRIGRHDFAAQGLGKLPVGAALKLEVLRGGDLPVLRLLQNNSAGQLVRNLRLLDLPRQGSLSKLTGLLSAANLSQSELPTDIKTLANQLLAKLPKALQAQQSAELKTLLQNSGLSLEHRLGQPPGTVNPALLHSDLKAAMLIFQHELKRLLNTEKQSSKQPTGKTTPPPNRQASPVAQILSTTIGNFQTADLLDAVESALARHRLNQLESLPREGELSRVWLMEIPLVEKENTDLLQLRIEQQKSEQEDQFEDAWVIEFAIAPKSLGPIHAKLKFKNKNLFLTIWAEEPLTENIFQRYKDTLLSQLRATGITSEQIQIFKGKPPEQHNTEKHSPLLEQQA